MRSDCVPEPYISLLDNLPTVVAIPISEYLIEESAFIALKRLSDAAELITRLFAIIALCDVASHLNSLPTSMTRELSEKMIQPTFGGWRDVAQLALRTLKTNGLPCFVCELPEYWRETWQPLIGTNQGNPHREVLALRNILAHSGRLPEEAAVEFLTNLRPLFNSAFQDISFLGNYECVATQEHRDGPILLKGLPKTGGWSPLVRDRAVDNVPYLEPEKVYFINKFGALHLFPLHIYDAVTVWREEEKSFRQVDEASPMLYSRFVERKDLVEFTALAPRTPIAQRGQDFLAQFLSSFNLPLWRSEKEEVEARRSEWKRWGYDFRSLRQELREGLVGREAQLESVLSWADERRATGGILWISGRPGVGKSAFLAELAERLSGDGEFRLIPFFFRNGDARCSPEHFFRAAMLRVAELFELPALKDPRESRQVQFIKMVEMLRESLLQVSPSTSAVFLIDGLDEVAGQYPEFARLPLSLNFPRIIWICAGRDEPPLAEIYRDASVGTVWTGGELSALTDRDVRILIEQECDRLRYEMFERDEQGQTGEYHNHFIDELTKRSEGLPLYVRLVIEDLKAYHFTFRDEDKLPDGLRDYFERILDRLKIGDVPQMLTDVLSLLCWTYESLTDQELADILAPIYQYSRGWKTTLAESLRFGSVMLRRSQTGSEMWGWTLYHESLRQHLRNTNTVATARERALHLLLRWCSRWPEHKSPYALRHYHEHLMASGHQEELSCLAEDSTFLNAQASVLTDEPDAPLRTIQAALLAAITNDDARRMASFCLSHALHLKQITQELPSSALRDGHLERAWQIADLHNPEGRALWYLLLACELRQMGKEQQVKETVARLLQSDVPLLPPEHIEYATELMTHLAGRAGALYDEHIGGFYDERVLDMLTPPGVTVLCGKLASRGCTAAARKIAGQVELGIGRLDALTAISTALARVGNLAEALTVSEEISDEPRRDRVRRAISAKIRVLALNQARCGRFDEAIETMSLTNVAYERALGLFSIAAEQVKARQVSDAIATARQLEAGDKRDGLYFVIASALIGDEEFKKASEIALEVDQNGIRNAILETVALSHLSAGNLIAARGTSQLLHRGSQRDEVLKIIARAHLSNGEIKNTVETALKIDEIETRNAILQNAAFELLRENQDATALDTAQLISDDYLRLEFLDALTKMQIASGGTSRPSEIVPLLLRSRDALSAELVEMKTKQERHARYLERKSNQRRRRALKAEGEFAKRTQLIQETLNRVARRLIAAREFSQALKTSQMISSEKIRAEIVGAVLEKQWPEQELDDLLRPVDGTQKLQDSVLVAVAQRQKQKRDFSTALKTAQRVQDLQRAVGVLCEIGGAQLMAEEEPGTAIGLALRIADQIDNPTAKVTSLKGIAELQMASRQSDAALVTLARSLQILTPVEGRELAKSTLIQDIARIQYGCGDLDAARASLIAAARSVLGQEGKGRSARLREVAHYQSQIGDFDEALTTTQMIADPVERRRCEGEVGEILVAHRIDAHEFAAALKAAESIELADIRVNALCRIAKAQSNSGDRPGAVSILEAALQSADRMWQGSEQPGISEQLAQLQIHIALEHASMGNLDEASQLVNQIESPSMQQRAIALLTRLKSDQLIANGQFTAALEAVVKIEDALVRTEALQAIAVAQAGGGDRAGACASLELAIRSSEDILRGRDRKRVAKAIRKNIHMLCSGRAGTTPKESLENTDEPFESILPREVLESQPVPLSPKVPELEPSKQYEKEASETISPQQAVGADHYNVSSIDCIGQDGASVPLITPTAAVSAVDEYRIEASDRLMENLSQKNPILLNKIVEAQINDETASLSAAERFLVTASQPEGVAAPDYSPLAPERLAGILAESSQEYSEQAQENALLNIVSVLAWAGEMAPALRVVDAMKNSVTRDWALGEIVRARIESTDFQGAVSMAQEIRDVRERVAMLREVAATQAEAGETEPAESTLRAATEGAKGIQDLEIRAEVFQSIGIIHAGNGSVGSAMVAFEGALSAVEQMEDPGVRAKGYVSLGLAESQARLGAQASIAFANASRLFESSGEGSVRAMVLSAVASFQVRMKQFDKAAHTIEEIRDEAERERQLWNLLMSQSGEGLFDAALASAQKIGQKWVRVEGLAAVAVAQYEWGCPGESYATLGLANDMAPEIREDQRREQALQYVAIAMAKCGHAELALEAYNLIRDSWNRALLLCEVALSQIRQGLKQNAHETFQKALEVSKSVSPETKKAQCIQHVAIAQAQAGIGMEALQTADSILVDRHILIPQIATTLQSVQDKDAFKRVVIPCAYYTDAAYSICGLLARLYPEDAHAIGELLASNV